MGVTCHTSVWKVVSLASVGQVGDPIDLSILSTKYFESPNL